MQPFGRKIFDLLLIKKIRKFKVYFCKTEQRNGHINLDLYGRSLLLERKKEKKNSYEPVISRILKVGVLIAERFGVFMWGNEVKRPKWNA